MSLVIVFLDIDGVLLERMSIDNTVASMLRHLFGHKASYTPQERTLAEIRLFNHQALYNLDKLLEHDPNIRIVVSSNWRYMGDARVLRHSFSLYNFANYIIDRTGQAINRGTEISNWLKAHPEVTKYVILDDIDDGISQSHKAHFVEIDRQLLLTGDNVSMARFKLVMQ